MPEHTIARRSLLRGAALLIGSCYGRAAFALLPADPAVGVAAREQLQANRVSVADRIPPAVWAGMLAGTAVDVTPHIQAALDTCRAGSTLYFPFCRSGYLVSNPAGSIEKIFTLPPGVHVYMEEGAWIFPSTRNDIATVFTPKGANILRVNIDGRSLPEGRGVGDSPGEARTRGPRQVWINSSFGVRAYATPDLGHGAPDVTVLDSRFRNLTHAIQTQGCSRWTIVDNRFEQTELSAILMGYLGGHSCYNTVERNHFQSIGDCAVAWHSSNEPVFEAAYNSLSYNEAVDTNLNTQGFAFDVESHRPDQQHHFQMVGNTVRQLTQGLPHGTGGCAMQNVGESIIASNTLIGSLGSNGDYGISCLESRNLRVEGNTITNFRASGIIMDGSTDGEVTENVITDCGAAISGSVYSAICLGLNHVSRGIRVSGNRVIYTDDYAHGGPQCTAIALRTSGGRAERIVIDNNEMISPWGAGIYINGLLAGGRVAGLSLTRNRVARTDAASEPAVPIQVYGADEVTIADTVLLNSRYGYFVQSSSGVTIRDGHMAGREAVLTLYDLTGSTAVRIANMRCDPPVVRRVIGATPGMAWVNDDNVS